MNKTILVGKAGADAKSGVTANGKSWANFRLATSEKIKDQWETTWHSIVGWGKTAETISMIRKGDKVFAVGKIQNREYIAKDGTKKTTFEILANEVIVQSAAYSPTASTNVGSFEADGEIAF